MGSNWKSGKLGDFVDSCLGKMLDKNKNKGDYYPYLGNSNVRWGYFELDSLSEMKFEPHEHEKYGLNKGDLIVCEGGEPGRCAIWKENVPTMKIQKALHRIRPLDGLDSEYLFYWFLNSGKMGRLDPFFTGTTIKHLTGKALSQLPIDIPPMGHQKYSASVLSSLDNKIELNKQTNKTLEQMAQTLFKSWFVDFDPVFDNLLAKVDFDLTKLPNDFPEVLLKRAEKRLLALNANESGEAVTSTIATTATNNKAHLQAGKQAQSVNIHQHFPSEFEFNEKLGWIPKGWEVKPVSQKIQVNPRTTLPKNTFARFADMKAIPTSGYMVDEVIDKEYKGGAKFVANDVLLARITPCLQNGKTALVDFLSDKEVGFGSTEFIVLRESRDVSYPFIACLAREDNFRAHCMQSMVGSSGRQRVQNACFDDYYLVLPKEDNLLKRFSELTKSNFEKMTSNKNESQSLTKLRDTLLPKLISGELKIPQDFS